MTTILSYLQGKKTYLIAILAGIYAALVGLGAVPSLELVWGILGSTGLATLRAGIEKAPSGSQASSNQ